jgi:tRNA nucleotidyltransferase (CCA-adding enzyme)
VFNELQLILQEENPAAAVARLNDFGLLRVVHPGLVCDKAMLVRLNSVQQVLAWYDLLFLNESYMKWAVYFLALTHRCETQQAREICSRFELAPRLQALFVEGRAQAEECLHGLTRRLPADNSTLYRQLEGFRTELVLFMMAATEQEKVKKAVSHYVTTLRRTTTSLKGRDLKALGVPPGPIYREVLQALLDARLNEGVRTREEELDLARKLIRART